MIGMASSVAAHEKVPFEFLLKESYDIREAWIDSE